MGGESLCPIFSEKLLVSEVLDTISKGVEKYCSAYTKHLPGCGLNRKKKGEI